MRVLVIIAHTGELSRGGVPPDPRSSSGYTHVGRSVGTHDDVGQLGAYVVPGAGAASQPGPSGGRRRRTRRVLRAGGDPLGAQPTRGGGRRAGPGAGTSGGCPHI